MRLMHCFLFIIILKLNTLLFLSATVSPGPASSHSELCHQGRRRDAAVAAADLRSAGAALQPSTAETLCSLASLCAGSVRVKVK